MPGKRAVQPKFRADSGQQHRLSSTARPNDQHVLAGRRIDIAPKNLQYKLEFAFPDHELPDHLGI